MTREHATATALEIAERRLLALGWKFSAEEIGEYAGKILGALNDELERKEPTPTNGGEHG